MTLVDGDFCPDLPYHCLRSTGAVGCAEYSRESRCVGEPDHRRYCIDRHEWPNRAGENPMVYVDWFEAKELCAGASKRLCRRSEWMLACEGPKRLPFPWGYVRQPSPCNIDRAAIGFDVRAMIDERTREGEISRLWQADRIGSHPDCVSSFGAYDMTGNVDEWTDDRADDPTSSHPSTLNGGYWGPVRDTCRLTTTSHGPDFKFYQVGFRCCADTIDGIEVPPPRPVEKGGGAPG
jgi:formylglycine-generating enzyme required for sulfatase activity